jgi:hypothetical protein
MPLDPVMLQRIDAAFQRPERADPVLERRHALLRLSCAPSLASVSYAWAIVGAEVRRPGSRAVVREIRVTRAGGEADGVDVRDAEVDLATAEAWCREAAGIRIPIVGVTRNLGCDGTTYTLSCEAGFASVRMTWWCSGPGEWSELTDWARGMMKRLHALTTPGEALHDP